MTELDKKHNDEALNVLSWKPDNRINLPFQTVNLLAFWNEYCFEINFDLQYNMIDLLIFNDDRERPIKRSSPQTVDIAKAQAELFILNLKR